MRRILLLSILLVLLGASPLRADKICDMGMAREWCDDAMLRGLEGIWEFPDDETRVLIRLQPGYDNRYDIIVVESPDTRLVPGETIGWIRGSALATKFEMDLYRERRDGILTTPGHCLAELSRSEDALVVTGHTVNLSFNLRYLLPSFWRSLRISTKNPLSKLPYGLRRLYPTSHKKSCDFL